MVETAEATLEDAGLSIGEFLWADLLPEMQRLDMRLERAAVAAQAAYGPKASSDLYRGLYISPEEVERLLARQLGEPTLYGDVGEISYQPILMDRPLRDYVL